MPLGAKPKILVTGANGFVGSGLLRRLSRDAQYEVVAAVRGDKRLATQVSRVHSVGDIGPISDWSEALESVETVVHAAARVHVMHGATHVQDNSFHVVNVLGTLRLAHQAAQAGVRRFVFVSSIKVNGETTAPNRPFTAYGTPAPLDPYGISKMDAERLLLDLCASTGMDCTIIRPPLVYGPNVDANFRTLMRWVRCGIPLPLARIDNRRSFVALENLVDLIVVCLRHPAATNQIFLVSDDEDVSTPQLVRLIAAALGRPPRLFSLPPEILRWGGNMFGMSDITSRLCESLQIDIAKTRQMLGWSPPVAIAQGLRVTAESFLAQAAI